MKGVYDFYHTIPFTPKRKGSHKDTIFLGTKENLFIKKEKVFIKVKNGSPMPLKIGQEKRRIFL